MNITEKNTEYVMWGEGLGGEGVGVKGKKSEVGLMNNHLEKNKKTSVCIKILHKAISIFINHYYWINR